jgi:phage FluMu protein Com
MTLLSDRTTNCKKCGELFIQQQEHPFYRVYCPDCEKEIEENKLD